MAVLTIIQNRIFADYIQYPIPTRDTVIMVVHWAAVSLVFTILTQWQVLRTYELPLRRFAKATKDVAGGDFSVYVKPRHTADKADYLDVMIEDFNKMVAELGSIETLKTEFFSNVSHEIKTPLSVIQNYAELLQGSNLTEEERLEYVATIISSTKKLSELITNILKLSKLEQQNIKPVPKRYDLCAQLTECALQFEKDWDEKEIDFEVDIEDRAMVYADESLIELVWNNLLSNAIKFTPKGGKVTLTQTSAPEEITVTVSDTGCGMSKETLKHMFDKFYQGDTSHKTEGNGLGLALSLRVLQLIGGTISATSTHGEGTTFTVSIPTGFDENDGRR